MAVTTVFNLFSGLTSCLRKIILFLRSTLLGITLFSILWTETTLAGSSFLSPEYKKHRLQQKDPKKPTAPLHHRSTEGFWDTDEAGAKDDRNSIEIKVCIYSSCSHTSSRGEVG
ncbi:appetite-regulating hormone [Harpia harpyja]|uniref:appetite-regulating hormone n=1 Tax=Harpia harpyja TaxID=202280 RepID=UPI0022B16604|nr:appetite-regulating hormone [Harpia harpyja]